MAAPIFRALFRQAVAPTPAPVAVSTPKRVERSNVFASRALYFATLLLFLTPTSIRAQDNQWAVKMFSELGTVRTHDFGSVALHAEVERRFAFKNIYKEDVVIASVASNCGCTKATATKTRIRSGETAEIVARVDTTGRQHTKGRKATITVVFSQPSRAEVQMQVKTYIRADVGFDPGSIEFGVATQGKSVVKRAYLQYEGRSDWALVGIQKSNPGIRAEAREARRTSTGVVYEILVELKQTAEPGYIHDLLKFKTNDPDPKTSTIFLPIRGVVRAPLTAKPSYLQLGVVPKNKTVTKNLVVCGSTPFQILRVDSKDKRMSFLKTDLKRTVHVVPVTFRAGSETGAINEMIVVETSQANEGPLRVVATGSVVDPENSTPTDAPADAPFGLETVEAEPSLTPAKTKPAYVALTTDDEEEPIRLDAADQDAAPKSDAKSSAAPAPSNRAPRRGINLFQEFPRRAPPVKNRLGAAETPNLDATLDRFGVVSATASVDARTPARVQPTSAVSAVAQSAAVRSTGLTALASPTLDADASEPPTPKRSVEKPLRRRPIPRELLPATIPR